MMESITALQGEADPRKAVIERSLAFNEHLLKLKTDIHAFIDSMPRCDLPVIGRTEALLDRLVNAIN